MKHFSTSLVLLLFVPALLLAQAQEVIDAYNLNTAIQSGNLEKVKELIQGKSNVNYQYNGRNALHTACNKGNLEAAKLILKAGVEVNSISEDGTGRTALQMVAGRMNPAKVPELVELLLVQGADPQLALNKDQYPLFASINRGHLEAVKLLLKHGASTQIKNSMDQDPRDYTIYLIERGVSDPDYKKKLQQILELLK